MRNRYLENEDFSFVTSCPFTHFLLSDLVVIE